MPKTFLTLVALMALALVAAPSFALQGDTLQKSNLYALEDEGVFEDEGIVRDEDSGIAEENDWFMVALEDEGILKDEDAGIFDRDEGVFEEDRGTVYDDPGDEGVLDW